jgi:hypothetical protein
VRLKNLFLITLLSMALSLTSVYAASVRIQFDLPYKKGLFSKKPNAKFREQAMQRAALEIWRSYQARLDSSKLAEIEKSRGAIEARLGDFITEITVIEETVNSDTLIVKYDVRGEVNDSLVSSIASELSGKPGTSGSGSLFAFLVVPRMQSDRQTFDATVKTKERAVVSAGVTTRSGDSVTDSENGEGVSAENSESATMEAAAATETSGSTIQKSDDVTWIAVETKGVNAEINKILTEAGYETTAADDLFTADCAESELSSQEIVDDMMSRATMTLSKESRRAITSAVKGCEVTFFATGHMDIDSIMQDEQSGGWRVRVDISIDVKNYEAKLPKNVASVKESTASIGMTQDEARDKALRDAGRRAAEIIVSQLRGKGLK